MRSGRSDLRHSYEVCTASPRTNGGWRPIAGQGSVAATAQPEVMKSENAKGASSRLRLARSEVAPRATVRAQWATASALSLLTYGVHSTRTAPS